MSIHPSLTASKGKKQRSVLKRYERIEKLKKESKWKDDTSSFGLPKVKVIKMKLKKLKTTEAKEGKEATGAAAKTASK
ncbi:MAG: small basic protein [Candidatus Omnitrophica bacterium]|nr:small basic protein [Candidatus Omnitrophota bacterium]